MAKEISSSGENAASARSKEGGVNGSKKKELSSRAYQKTPKCSKKKKINQTDIENPICPSRGGTKRKQPGCEGRRGRTRFFPRQVNGKKGGEPEPVTGEEVRKTRGAGKSSLGLQLPDNETKDFGRRSGEDQMDRERKNNN